MKYRSSFDHTADIAMRGCYNRDPQFSAYELGYKYLNLIAN